jgi:hypothetical protein
MAHAYTIIPAKPAFGNYSKHFSYIDVIANKRANHIYFNCNKTNRINSQSDLMAIRKITNADCATGCNILPFNKSNLQVNLITELDLNNIIILQLNSDPGKPAKIDPALTPIYSYYTIDPNNKLSGDTPCAIQKYVNYMILNTDAFIDGGCPPDDFTPDCFCKP